MPLINFTIKPGINKEVTDYTGQGQWVDSDNVRFFNGLPQKIKGWQKLIEETVVGVVRASHAFLGLDGTKYLGLGTDRKLYVYVEGVVHDITPIRQSNTGATSVFTTSTGSSNVTVSINSHGALTGDFVTFDNVTLSNASTSFDAATFEDKEFEVQGVANANAFYIDTETNEANAGITAQGSTDADFQINVGPSISSLGYGWGTDSWGSSTWGTASSTSNVTIEARQWSLDNFGEDLIATVKNGGTFIWDNSLGTGTRATAIANAPTASRLSLVSSPDRHLVLLGTENIIGTPAKQDDLLIRFSDQENINEYTVQATNSSGTFRLQDGTKIIGSLVAKETILIWTDNALYTMKFVGAPFTFGFEQVGTNCGLIGKNAVVEIDGVAYWMSTNGFFAFDGTVKTLACSVEDYVYDDIDTTKGQQIFAGLNNLFTEVIWWYPTSGSDFNNRYVVYNYGEDNLRLPMGNWYTGVNANSIRTSWIDSLIYPKPYSTAYNSLGTGNFPVVLGETGLGSSVFFEQETGTDQVNPDGTTTTLTSFVESFNFSLQKDQSEIFLAMRRFLPNFKVLTGHADVTISVSDYPSSNGTATTLSPFTITSSTTKVDTRARGRYANIKIENTGSGETWRFGTFQVDLQPDGRR